MARKFSKTFWCFSAVSLCLMVGFALWGVQAAAQGSHAAHGDKSGSIVAKKKEVKFEVISIRPVKPGWSPYDGAPAPLSNANPTPDGFLSTLTVWQMLMIAYAPDDQSWGNIPVVNSPSWAGDWYVINARVSDADVEAWRNQSGHHELLRSAMRDLLKERCKLVVHQQPTELPDYKLVIRKKGLKMKAAVPGSAPPKGYTLPSGAVRFATGPRERPTWHYYGATIGDLVEFLSPSGTGSPRPPVHEETGLTERYDFTVQMVENPSRDRAESIYNFPVAPLGLELKPGKYRGFKLVIDHLEKPSPN